MLHAAGKRTGHAGAERLEHGHVKQFGESRPAFVGSHFVKGGIKPHVFFHAQVFVQAEFLRHVADALLDFRRLLDGIESQHAGGAGGGPHQTAQGAQQRGLTGRVRTKQAHDLTGRQVERHVGKCGDGASRARKDLGKTAALDRIHATALAP
ncbi:hypothetical protein SDC9_148686 [bioreactor metagenome]|uniref:Uncharacterized protein n=1 Tax=bioreactor metagenome TaxID=1076179 RepID=A0A645EI94_9ZZZZ